MQSYYFFRFFNTMDAKKKKNFVMRSTSRNFAHNLVKTPSQNETDSMNKLRYLSIVMTLMVLSKAKAES